MGGCRSPPPANRCAARSSSLRTAVRHHHRQLVPEFRSWSFGSSMLGSNESDFFILYECFVSVSFPLCMFVVVFCIQVIEVKKKKSGENRYPTKKSRPLLTIDQNSWKNSIKTFGIWRHFELLLLPKYLFSTSFPSYSWHNNAPRCRKLDFYRMSSENFAPAGASIGRVMSV